MSFRFVILMLMFPVMLISCKKEQHDNIPYAYINLTIYPNSTMYIRLNVVGGWEYIVPNNAGNTASKGLIVYRYSLDEFRAYERTCPYDPTSTCASGPVKVEKSGATAVDSCCMSRFILTDGSPFSGPSNFPLRQYTTSYDGNALHISN